MGEKEGTKCFAPLRPTKRGAQFRATKAFVTPQRWKRVYGMNARTRTPYARSKKKKKKSVGKVPQITWFTLEARVCHTSTSLRGLLRRMPTPRLSAWFL